MHNFLGIKNKVDTFRKGLYTDPYDEPTFITFAIDFNFESAQTILKEFQLKMSPLFEEKGEGAITFLKNRGHEDKAHGLKVFKNILRYLTFDAPWYFQSISGVGSLWRNSTASIESGMKTKGATLTINTLEAVDLRITELADIYRNAMYDKIHLRERVPDNLRWFSMDIYIAEARNLRYRLPGVAQNVANTLGINTAQISNLVGAGNIFSNVLDQYGFIKFSCRQCEFDFSETFAGGNGEISVTTKNTPATNSFKINVGYFEESSEYADGSKLFDDQHRSDINNPWSLRNANTTLSNAASFLSGLPVIGEGIQNAGQAVQNSLASVGGLINPALGAATNFLEPPVKDLGNIYGK